MQRWTPYAMGIAFTVLAALTRWALPGTLAGTPYLAFYPAVVAAAGFYGMGPGLVATIGSLLCVDIIFDATPGWIALGDPVVLGRSVIFLAGGAGISVVAGMRKSAQAHQRRQAEELAQVVRLLDLADVLARDLDGRITRWNPGCQRLYGFTAEQAVGRISHDLLRTRFPEPSESIRARLMETGRWEGELVHTAADGRELVVASEWILFRDALGQPTAVLEVNTDITARKRAEEKLRESEQFFRQMLESIPGMVFTTRPDGYCDYQSQQWVDYTGVPMSEHMGDGWNRLLHAEDRPRAYAAWQAAVEGRAPYDLEYRVRRHDGQYEWFKVIGRPIRDTAGTIVRWFGVALNIESLKRAEQAMRESEERFRNLADAAPMLIWQCDADRNCNYFNKGWLEFTGRTMEEELGSGWIAGVHPDDRQRCLESFVSAVGRRAPFEIEYRLRHHAGEYRWVLDRGVPRCAADGSLLGYIGGGVDISRRKLAEEELRSARDSAECAKGAAELANRAKDHFLAVLSHELRTPLTPVVMGVSMLQKRPDLAPEACETLEMVRRNVEMEARLIDDLLDVTRIARGKIELNRSPVELCTVIQRAVEVCKPDIEARKLHFGVDMGPAAPYWVEADVPRLQQVFWNLLKNAVKFTPHGGCVGIRCRPNESHVLIEVNDSGIGIEPDALTRIFHAFEQAERSISRQFGGLGLGLAISKALVEMHGGMIEAHSEGRNQGATFRIRLPMVAPAGQPEAPAARPPQAVRPLRILLVEDHGVSAKMMRTVLTAEGHTVEVADDVATALELADGQAFDMLLSDLGLPDGSGYELLRELRARGHRFPAVALSGYGQEDDIRRSYQAGFVTHLTKPASVDVLFEAVALAAGGETPGTAKRVPL